MAALPYPRDAAFSFNMKYHFIMYYLYILKCKDGSLYTGITTDVERRLKEHKNKTGARYTRSHGVGRASKMLYTESFPTRSAAQKKEYEIKSWRREVKLAFLRDEKRIQ